jgi:uncharacterized membrane protein YdjX (TVP38/TMEM64 family)
MGLVYLIIGSLAGAYALVGFERYLHNSFLHECLGGSVKKQNMNRFARGLINSLVHVSPK